MNIMAQSVCQRAFCLLEIRIERPWFKSCIQQRKTTCLLSIPKSLACARASQFTATHTHTHTYIYMYIYIYLYIYIYIYRQSQVRKPTSCEFEWAACSLIIGTGYWVQVLAWSSMVQSVCQWAFSLMKICFQRPWILHFAEEGNLSPGDSKIACLYQSTKINNNRHGDILYIQQRSWTIVLYEYLASGS